MNRANSSWEDVLIVAGLKETSAIILIISLLFCRRFTVAGELSLLI